MADNKTGETERGNKQTEKPAEAKGESKTAGPDPEERKVLERFAAQKGGSFEGRLT